MQNKSLKILAIGDFHGKFPAKLQKKIKTIEPHFILSTGDYAAIEDFRPHLKKHFKALQKGKRLNFKEIIGKKKFARLLKKDYAVGKEILKELDEFGIKVFSVFGNGDWYKFQYNKSNRDYGLFIKKLSNIRNINRGKSSFNGLKIVGFGGYLDPDIYFTKKGIKSINASEKRIKIGRRIYKAEEKRLMKLMENKPDILLIHYTPYNCLDKMKARGLPLHGEPMGVSSFNRAIRKYQPLITICGHMHENQGKCKIGKTLIINPGSVAEGKAALIELEGKKIKGLSFFR